MADQHFTRVRRFGIVNLWIVEEDDGLTVIDTAMKASKQIVQAAALKSQPIKRVILTHAHDDHVGSLDALVEAVPDVAVIMSPRDARLLAGDFSLDDDEPQDKIRGSLKGQKTVPTRDLVDGESIGSLKAIFTPGHTPGHFSLLDERDGTVFTGDVFSTLGGLATSAVYNPLFPLVRMGTWHPPTVLESATKLWELKPDRLAPGHGRVFENPAEDMEKVLEKTRKRLDE